MNASVVPLQSFAEMNARRALVMGAAMGLLDFFGAGKAASARTPASALAGAYARPIGNGSSPQGATAQLIGGNVITPLRNIGFPADHFFAQLLPLGPEGKAPPAFRATVVNTSGTVQPFGYARRFMIDLCKSYSMPVSFYNREVEGYHMFLWNGVRMNGLQVVSAFSEEVTAEKAREIWFDDAYLQFGNVSKPVVTSAPGLSGWNGQAAAWRLIATPEAKAIWLTSADAPNIPKDEQPNESGVQLILGHPDYDSGRKPLAYFTAPAVVRNEAAKAGYPQERKRVAALRESVEQVCAIAGLAPTAIGTVMRDSGRGSREAATRLSDTMAAVHPLMPDLDITGHMLDMTSLLGELGASTVNYSLLMAAFACHERMHPVLYLSSRDPEAARAMLVLPSPQYSTTDVPRRARDADPGQMWNRPWWGERLDGKADY